MKYEQLYKLTMEQGGATVRVKDYPETIMVPKVGFAVGNSSDSIIIPVNDTEHFDHVQAFDQVVTKQLAMARQYGVGYIGTWLNDGFIHVDLVDVFKNRDFALGVGWARGEQAIYDLAEGKEIALRYK